jgi:hypothetical protein
LQPKQRRPTGEAEAFGILTQKDYIPSVSFHAAKLLLQLEKHYHIANMVQVQQQKRGFAATTIDR